MYSKIMFVFFAIIILAEPVTSGPLAYAACQAACAAGAATIAGAGALITTPAAVAAYAACQTGCVALLIAPVP